MGDPQAIAGRLQIKALRGEYTDTSMMRDWDRFASLFTHDGAWRIPDGNVELIGRGEIRARIARLRGLREYFAASRVTGIGGRPGSPTAPNPKAQTLLAQRLPGPRRSNEVVIVRHRAAYKQPWPSPLGGPSCPKYDR
jgi:SnoaL-like domain